MSASRVQPGRPSQSSAASGPVAKDCAECQRHLGEDERLIALARTLSEPVESPQLWLRVERALQKERSRSRGQWIWKAAAVLIVGIGLGYAVFHDQPPASSGLLKSDALAQVEQAEDNYIDAIADLEHLAEGKLSTLDSDLSYLYRDKLAMIDEQITNCREAIGENPANGHVRRYLLAALGDKRAVLEELVAYEPSVQ